MSDFGRMREYAGAQADYIEELEAVIDGLPEGTRSMFPTRPEALADNPLAPPEQPPTDRPTEPPAEPPAEPAP